MAHRPSGRLTSGVGGGAAAAQIVGPGWSRSGGLREWERERGEGSGAFDDAQDGGGLGHLGTLVIRTPIPSARVSGGDVP